MRMFLALLVAASMAMSCWAADAVKLDVVPPELTATTSDYFQFKVNPQSELKSFKWLDLDPSIKVLGGPGITIESGYHYLRFTKKGTFWLTGVGVTEKFDILQQRIKVTVVDENVIVTPDTLPVGPTPKPPPPPMPPPATEVKEKVAVLVAFEETANASKDRETYINSKEVQDMLGRITPYSLDKDLSQVNFRDKNLEQNMRTLLQNCKSFPWLFLMSASGKVLYSGPFPENNEALKKLLMKWS